MSPLRLIDVDTLQLADSKRLFDDEEHAKKEKKIIPYAILSHRWLNEEDEVQFDDLKSLETARTKKGFTKIYQTCKLAKEQGIQYVWLDTCCINKNNSAELQESINSMFRWYQEATICYTCLQDTDAALPGSMDGDEWFTRGWTLQELIAPRDVAFFDKNWQYLGGKAELKNRISAITKVDVAVLENPALLESFSVASRLSWAANRITKKLEDRAYSLIGILGVSMPTLYGEGEKKAFLRLQEEFIKTSDDHSIFAWKGVQDDYPGLLAESLDRFQECGSIRCTRFRRGRSAFSITNRGISITLNLTQWTLDTYVARIHCVDLADSQNKNTENGMTGLFLRRLEEDDQYARIKIDGRELVHDIRAPLSWTKTQYSRHSKEVPIFVRQNKLSTGQLEEESVFGFRLGSSLVRDAPKNEAPFSFARPSEGTTWNEAERTLTLQPGFPYFGVIAHLNIAKQGKKIKEMKLCFDFNFNPILILAESSAISRKDAPMLTASGQINTANVRTYSEQERHRWLSLAERSPHDEYGWNNISDRTFTASANTIRTGLWQLKGDRIEGLNVALGGSQIRVTLKKVTTDFGRKCWELDFENMPGSSLKKLFR